MKTRNILIAIVLFVLTFGLTQAQDRFDGEIATTPSEQSDDVRFVEKNHFVKFVRDGQNVIGLTKHDMHYIARGANGYFVGRLANGERVDLDVESGYFVVVDIVSASDGGNTETRTEGVPATNGSTGGNTDCSSPYSQGWDATGRVITPSGLETGFFVYLRKQANGANVGSGIYSETLPAGESIHVWSFKTKQCAELNKPFINGA